MVDSLVDNQQYDEVSYIKHFRFWFDFGGSWQGYIDKATRMSLLNIHQLQISKRPLLQRVAQTIHSSPAVSKDHSISGVYLHFSHLTGYGRECGSSHQ